MKLVNKSEKIIFVNGNVLMPDGEMPINGDNDIAPSVNALINKGWLRLDDSEEKEAMHEAEVKAAAEKAAAEKEAEIKAATEKALAEKEAELKAKAEKEAEKKAAAKAAKDAKAAEAKK